MFAYCGNNPIIFVDNTGTYYTSGQIHNFVVEDICKNNPNKHGKNTYMTYKEPYQKGNRYYLYGYCDVFDMSTHEIWEVKRYGGGSSCSVAAASRQLRNYVKNGILSYYAPWEQHIGGTFTTIEMNTFHKRDNDGSGTYVISYWDAGGGIVFYDYYYLPGPEELLMLLECAVVVAAVGAGAMCCYICIDIAFNPHRRW